MPIDYQSIQRIEHFKPFLRYFSVVMEAMIADDAQDIMVFATKEHPSPFHHNQWGFLLKLAADLGTTVLDIAKKSFEYEDRQNIELKSIQYLLKQVLEERRVTEEQEKLLRQKMLINMKQAFEMAKANPQIPREIIYGGNINDIRVNRPRPLPEKIEPPIPPKAKLQL